MVNRVIKLSAILFVAVLAIAGSGWGNPAWAAFITSGNTQWTTTGAGIHYDGGNVGIGTSTPGVKLDVSGVIRMNVSGFNQPFHIFNPSGNSAIRFSETSSLRGGQIQGYAFGSGSEGTLQFDVTNSAGALIERMRISNNGNVGIGTTGPATKLEIFGTTTASANGQETLRLTNSILFATPGSGPELVFQGQDAGTSLASLASIRGYIFGSSLSGLAFETGYNANTVKMVIDNSGNVGIGTSSPISKLAVSGGTGNIVNLGGGQLAGLNSTPLNVDHAVPLGYLEANYTPSGTAAGGVGNGISGQTLRHDGTSWVANSLLFNNGTNVGVGVTNPARRLAVGSLNGEINNQIGLQDPSGTLQASVALNTGTNDLLIANVANLRFYSGSTIGSSLTLPTNERMVISSAGNVGIGKTNPAYILDVLQTQNAASRFQMTNSSNGAAAQVLWQLVNDVGTSLQFGIGSSGFSGSSAPGEAYLQNNPGPIYFRAIGANNYLRFGTNGQERMRFDATGNIGVGTTTPNVRLYINGGTGNVIAAGGGQVSGLNSTPLNSDHAVPLGYLQANYAPIGTGAGAAFVQDGNSFGGVATLGTNDNNLLNIETNNAVRMTVAGAGNVGIGITNPAEKLHIMSGNIRVQGGINTAKIILDESNYGGVIQGILEQSVGGHLTFSTLQNGVATERLRIKNDGNVGIGTTAPAAKTHIYVGASGGAPYSTSDLVIEDSARATLQFLSGVGVENAIYFGDNLSPTSGQIMYYHSDDSMRFNTVAGNTLNLKDGNVGIGTTTPGTKLTVSGGTGNVIAAGGGQLAGLNSTPLNSDHAVPLGYLQANYTPSGTAAGGVGNGTSGQTLRHDGTSWVANSIIYNNGANVGIGTTNPTALLHLGAGDIKLTQAGSGNTRNIDAGTTRIDFGNSSSQSMVMSADGAIRFDVDTNNNEAGMYVDFTTNNNATSLMRIQDNGNVGIGTTGPDTKLTIKTGDPTFGQGLTLMHDTSSAGRFVGINFGSNANSYRKAAIAFRSDGGSNGTGDLVFALDSNNDAAHVASTDEKMRILASGNVGIGTTAPTQKLDVAGSVSLSDNGVIGRYAGSAWQGNIQFASSVGTIIRSAGSDLMSITNGGNVGIATTTPNTKLTLFGGTGNSLNMSGGQVSGLNSTPINSDHAVPLGYLQANYSPSSGSLWSGTQNGTIWNGTTGAGNVGIGTTNPSTKLEIQGDALALRVRGTATGTTWSGRIVAGGPNVAFLMGEYNTMAWLGAHNAGLGAWADFYINPDGAMKLYLGGTGDTNPATLNPIITVDNATGNVGIGTTTPAQRLQVAGYVRGDTGFCIGTSCITAWPSGAVSSVSNSDTTLTISPTTGAVVASLNLSKANSWVGAQTFTASTNFPSGIWNSSGNVGVGTATAGTKLTVSGGTGNAIAAGGGHVSGLNSTPTNSDHAVPLGYLQANYSPSGTFLALAGGTMSGDIAMSNNDITGVYDLSVNHKLTVPVIDPLYSINGVNYSTYASSIVGGLKEEYVGRLKVETATTDSEGGYEAVIDFTDQPEGSDLWIWREVVDFSADNIEVSITPYGKFAQVYYVIEGDSLIFRSDRPAEISYRLVGKRFDWREWPTLPADQSEKAYFVR